MAESKDSVVRDDRKIKLDLLYASSY